MAGRGAAPKDPETRARTNSDPAGRTTLIRDGRARGPQLPKDVGWHPRTREWWQTWRRSPQAVTFEPTDWEFLLETALLHSAFWRGDEKVAAELRLRVAKFGATVEDRARLRIDITDRTGTTAPASSAAAKARYGHLRSVGGAGAVAGA